jgi:very-short-patch-repair endonuclease
MPPFQPVFHDYNKNLINRAKANRKEMTIAERRMWFDILKHLPYRFLKQRVIGNYIADFYCAARQLVIEVDGDAHLRDEAIEYDTERAAYFTSLGIRVIRFTNNEVLQNSDGVYQKLKRIMECVEY